jgi:hypothetical protein
MLIFPEWLILLFFLLCCGVYSTVRKTIAFRKKENYLLKRRKPLSKSKNQSRQFRQKRPSLTNP